MYPVALPDAFNVLLVVRDLPAADGWEVGVCGGADAQVCNAFPVTAVVSAAESGFGKV